MKKLTISSLLLLSFFSLASLTETYGCECMARPPVLDEFERSNDVFIGEVAAIVKGDASMYRDGIQGARIIVQKVYKGDLKKGDSVFFDQGGGSDCRLTYDEKSIGWKLLIYNSPYDGHRSIIVCGRSSSLEGANDDLRYLDNLSWTKGKTRISGKVSFGYFGKIPEAQSITGKKIRVIGKEKTFTATTDSTGLYEIYDVPPGEYLIEPEIPRGWKLNDYALDRTLESYPGSANLEFTQSPESKNLSPNQFPIRVQAGRHVSFDFMYEIDNSISGRLLGPDGIPLKNICIHAIPPDHEDSLYGFTDCTNAEGRFEITGLPHPEYILVINGDGEVSGKSPLPKTYFPGVLDRSKATIIKMRPGEKPNVGEFKVPKILETVVLTGVLLYSNGSPVESRTVQFVPDDPAAKRTSYVFYDHTKTDGSFRITILKGQTGRLRGEYYTGKKVLDLCPDWRKAIIEPDKMTNWMVRAATEWIDIKADGNVSGIKFVFPFNSCDKE